jgi:hypothetical protein
LTDLNEKSEVLAKRLEYVRLAGAFEVEGFASAAKKREQAPHPYPKNGKLDILSGQPSSRSVWSASGLPVVLE